MLPDVRPIINLISLVLHTGGLSGRRPVSALLCSPPDNGKTVWIMDRFLDNTGIHRANIMTRIGLARWLLARNRYLHYHHILIPDMTAPLSGQRPVAEAFQGFLMGLVYDGITDFHSFNLPSIQVAEPVVIGVIAGIVPSVLLKRKKEWAESGFLRRFLPVSYDYTREMDAYIDELILQGRNLQPQMETLNKDIWNRVVSISDEAILPLLKLAQGIAAGLNVPYENLKGHTYVEMLRSLVLAHALRRGSLVAGREDVATVIRLSRYMNYRMERVPTL